MPNAEGWFSYRGLRLYHGPVERAWIEEALGRAPDSVVEIGSWDGGDTVRYGQWWPVSRRLAIEADPERFLFVDLACKLSGAYAVHAAIGAINGECGFYRCFDADGYGPAGSLYRRTAESRMATPQIQFTDTPVTVPARRFRTLMAECGFDAAPDFVHVDVEGAELDVLLGFGDFRPRVVLLEKGVDAWAHEGAASYAATVAPLMCLMGYTLAREDTHDDLWQLAMTASPFARMQAYEVGWGLAWLRGSQSADPIDLKREFFADDAAEWAAFMAHVTGKRVLEVGCGPAPQVLDWPAASTTLVEPLWNHYAPFLPPLPSHVHAISERGEDALPTFTGSVDGAIVCRNTVDHTDAPVGLIEAVLAAAAPGCYVLFWSARKHLAPDEGHRSYADSDDAVRDIFRARGFEIIREVHCCPATHTEDWGALARRR